MNAQFNKIHLLINPATGKGSRISLLQKIEAEFRDQFPQTAIFKTQKKGDAELYCDHIKDEENSLIVICGGDGTINEVVNGLGIRSTVAFCVLPIGSGNDFCRTAGYVRDLSKLISQIKNPGISNIDLGLLQYKNQDDIVTFSRCFASSAGIGFDALVAKLSNRESFLKGLPLYLSSVFIGLNGYKSLEVRSKDYLTMGNNRKFMLSFGNGRTSGGGFILTPKASISDGLIDICTVDELSKVQVMNLLPKAIPGKHLNSKYVNYFQTDDKTYEIKDSFIMHFDGEVQSFEPGTLRIQCLKSSIRILK